MFSIFKTRYNPHVFVTTDRFILRAPCTSDAKTILRFYLDNKDHLAPWDPLKPKDFYTIKRWKKWVALAQSELKAQKACRMIIEQPDTGHIIGFANFTNFDGGAFQNARLGYKIAERYQGQGLMTESLREAIAYLFQHYPLHRIEANYMPRNTRSGAVLKRLGFTEHGIAPRYLKIAGTWEDHILTSILNE